MIELLKFTNNEQICDSGYINYSDLPLKLKEEIPNLFQKIGINEKCTVGVYCRNTYLFMPILIVLDKIGCNVLLYNESIFKEKKHEKFPDANYVITDQIVQEIVFKEILFFEEKVYFLQGTKENESSSLGIITFYTSGTTGKSDQVLKNNSILIKEAVEIAQALNLTADDKILCNAPVFHTYGQTFGCYIPALVGAKVKYLPTFGLTTHILKELENGKYTVLVSTPAYYKLLYKQLNRFKTLRYKLSAGGKLADEIIQAGVKINNVYGSTETGTVSIQLFTDSEDSASVGHEIKGARVEFEIENDEQKKGKQLKVWTPYMALAIKKGDTCHPIEKDGMVLSDVGYRDENGNIYILGRKDNIIKINGKKVSIDEVEAALGNLEYVVEYKIEKRNMNGEDSMIAFVSVKNRETVNDIRRSLSEVLVNYKIPKDIRVVNELRKGEMGKILANQEYYVSEDNKSSRISG